MVANGSERGANKKSRNVTETERGKFLDDAFDSRQRRAVSTAGYRQPRKALLNGRGTTKMANKIALISSVSLFL